jgi:tetratricopeptide (TPR) repeat protein
MPRRRKVQVRIVVLVPNLVNKGVPTSQGCYYLLEMCRLNQAPQQIGSAVKARISLLMVAIPLLLLGCSRDPNVRKAEYVAKGKTYYAAARYEEAVIEFKNAIQIDSRYAEAHYQLGRAYQGLRLTESAYREFESAVTLDPANRDAKLQLAGLLIARRRFADAEKMAQSVANEDPANARAHMVLGENYAASGQLPKAIEELQKAAAAAPESLESHFALAAIYSAAGKMVEAENVYKQVIAAHPQSSVAHVALGEFYFSQKKTGDAANQLKLASDLAPRAVSPKILLGRVYLAAGQLDEAEQLYRNLKAAAPDDPQAYTALANLYVETGQKQKAVAELKSLSASKPKDISVKASLIETLLDLQQFKEAASALAQPLQSNSDNPRLLSAHGRILLSERKYQDAIQELQKAVAADGNFAGAFYFLGVAQKSAGQTEQARNSFRRALQLSPRMGQAEAALATMTLRSENPDEASRLADQAMAKSPGAAPPYVAKAMAVIAKGDTLQGEKLLEEALQRDPMSLAALATLLKLSASEGKTPQVLQRISALRNRHPENAGLYFLQALGQFGLHDLTNAEASVKQAIKLDPQTRDAYALLAQIHLAEGLIDQAKSDLRNAIAANPGVTSNYTSLGAIYERQNNWEEAKKLFQKAHELDAEAPMPAAELAFLYLDHGGDVNVALSLAQTARRGAPDSPVTADALGWAYYKLGSADLAIKQLRESTVKLPNNPVYQYHLGMAYLSARRTDMAAQSLRAALKNNPNFPYAESARAALSEIATRKRDVRTE